MCGRNDVNKMSNQKYSEYLYLTKDDQDRFLRQHCREVRDAIFRNDIENKDYEEAVTSSIKYLEKRLFT